MGVHELWSILEPVRKSVPLYSLSGKTLAVDLSLWVCEAQHVQAMMGRVTKPHLRNLFFRVSSLTLMGVKLVFVMEGEAPKLKAETMNKRNQGRFGAKAAAAPKGTIKTNRGRFKAVLRECAEMLDYMGVPWVTAAGEAEAMCAYLDSQGLVDGCITNDGDVFLYGARTVYRNFNMNTKDPQVDCYQTSHVQRDLHLSRENLVGLAIFLGCDYIPKGIQGVGKEQALRLIYKLEGQTILQKFSKWKEDNTFIPESTVKKVSHCNVCRHPGSAKAHEKSGCLLCDSKRFCEPQDFDYQCPCDWHLNQHRRQAISLETNIRKKTIANPLFPFTEIINEFLISKDKSEFHFKRRLPNMLLMQKFAYDKMEWPKHYTSEKLLILMTYMNLMNKKYGRDVSIQVKPLRILKPRVRNGVSCFEVVWTKPEHYAFPEDPAPENQDEVRTVEEESLFRVAYPEVVEIFLREKATAEENKNKKKKPKSKKEKMGESDGISDLLAQMTLQSSLTDLQPQTATLPLSISSPDKLDIVVLDTPVRHEKQENDGSLGLDDCPKSPALPPESKDAASLSVSAVINALHLSDIDWDTASFTSSPLPPTTTSTTMQPKIVQSLHVHVNEVPTSISVSELCEKEQPLQDQLIMKNTSQINKNITAEQGSKRITLNDKNYHAESKLLEKTRLMKNLCVPFTTQCELHVSKQPMKHPALDPDPIPSKNTCKAPPKPPQKFKFVKTAVASSLLPQRCYSDPVQIEKVKLKTLTKKSVCASGGLSSDDSDSENQQVAPKTKSKTKIKIKAKQIHQLDILSKPVSKAVGPKAQIKNHKPRSYSLEVGTVETIRFPMEYKCKDAFPSITDDVFSQCPPSPAADLESDNSVICSDSPLPLTERLKLKFQK
ncbi:flap endonuclease GEN homolog 1 [Boleophthalmus pectinirostris]|uniref:flap endonuclease GEN homolog 1 n=1 Tax=Boleophthalmus pectinirostris TaxID=150288 RepID=UPI00242D722B|nr:flap endonuclease GEN homolog 1 [Boleophthalmus pectinirostris]